MCIPKLHSTCKAITESFLHMYILPKNQEHTNLKTVLENKVMKYDNT